MVPSTSNGSYILSIPTVIPTQLLVVYEVLGETHLHVSSLGGIIPEAVVVLSRSWPCWVTRLRVGLVG